MTPEDLRKLFIEISAEAVKRYPASQYFYDDGKYVRHGFTCGGYHLWLRMPTRGDIHFEIGPVPITKVKPTEHLIVGAGTLPYDEMKAGMVSPKRLQFYWDMADNQAGWFDNPQGWGGARWWFQMPAFTMFRTTTDTIMERSQGRIFSGAGEAFYFNIPSGELIPPCQVALVQATEQGTPPVALLRGADGFGGCIAAGRITKETKESFNFKIGTDAYLLERTGGKFTIKQQEEKMNFNIPKVDPEKAKKNTETPVKAEVEKETTNPPVVPVAAEKPAKTVGDSLPSPEEVFPDTPEPTLRERLEKAFSDAETLKTLAAELLKELRPILKEASKLEKGAADSAEVKELRSKNKTLEAENTRLKGAVKLLSEKL